MRKSKTKAVKNREVQPPVIARFQSDEFLWDLLATVESVWHLKVNSRDLTPTVGNLMEARRLKIDVAELRQRRLMTAMPADRITYREIFRGLCELCTKELTDGQKVMVYWMLQRCYICEFKPFVRLTNSRHNPNQESRRWAIATLAMIAGGKARYVGQRSSHSRTNWKAGAIKRLRELHRSGALLKDQLYLEQLGLHTII